MRVFWKTVDYIVLAAVVVFTLVMLARVAATGTSNVIVYFGFHALLVAWASVLLVSIAMTWRDR